jgi:hypothetical protein
MAEWQFSSENTGGYCLHPIHSLYKSLPLINEKTEPDDFINDNSIGEGKGRFCKSLGSRV